MYQDEKAQADADYVSKGQLVLPAHAKMESREYKPVQFEGSLGRLTASSVHKPRQVCFQLLPRNAPCSALKELTLSVRERPYQ